MRTIILAILITLIALPAWAYTPTVGGRPPAARRPPRGPCPSEPAHAPISSAMRAWISSGERSSM